MFPPRFYVHIQGKTPKPPLTRDEQLGTCVHRMATAVCEFGTRQRGQMTGLFPGNKSPEHIFTG